jgi:putative transposase
MVQGTEIFRMDAKAEKIALFRFALIAPLVIETLPRGELTRRAEEIASRLYDIPDSKRRAVSVDTLLEWAKRYRNGGFEALAPQPRQDRGQSRTITPQLASLVERLKRENPHRTGTTLLRELALSSGRDAPRRKVEKADVTQAIANIGEQARYTPVARRDHASY